MTKLKHTNILRALFLAVGLAMAAGAVTACDPYDCGNPEFCL